MNKEKRFIEALYSLCLDHGYFIHGMGQEDYLYIRSISEHPVLVFERGDRFFMDDKASVIQYKRLTHDCYFMLETD